MIVQALGEHTLVITQPDHAALAGRIMQHWSDRGLQDHPRRASIQLAIAEHDNGWREVDEAPAVDPGTGCILDFMTISGEVRRGVWPRAVERLSRDPWAAALVAQHAVHVYRRFRADAEWQGFFSALEETRDRHVGRAAGQSLDDLLSDYFFVRMGDLLSLTFCNGWSEAPDEMGFAIRGQDRELTVNPDPFDGREVAIEIPARELPLSFPSAAEAARQFTAAPVIHYRGTIRGAT